MKHIYSLEQVAQEALAGIRDFESTRYAEAVMYVMRGLRDFQLFHGTTIKYSWEKITPIKTVTFPEDYLSFLSIGVPLNGGIFTLTKEKCSLIPSDPLQTELSTVRGEDEAIKKSAFGYGSNSSNTEGYFAIDTAHDRIVLKQAFLDFYAQSVRDEILLTYVPSGISGNIRDSYIPTAAANMLIAYVENKLVSSMPEKYPANYRAEKQYNVDAETEKFDLLSLPSIDELYDAIYSTSAQIRR